ncbi:MAG: GGDEF domain-containing protein [Chloroflexi bacterium]|nr:GGDEF domain-containing protein [Chloroflexota bacterium]
MDAVILTFVQFPTLYFLMLRPMEREIAERRRSENELRRAKELLEFANREVNYSLEREQILARTDGLTGLYNYRHFFELASREFEASVRYQRPLAIIIFDIDYLKKINDTLGHSAGDKMLITATQAVANQMRGVDVLARYGGDEFVIMLPETSAQEAFNIAERIRVSVAAGLLLTDFNKFAITLSMGVSELLSDPADENIEQVVQRADKALYIAKETGRNRAVILPAK